MSRAELAMEYAGNTIEWAEEKLELTDQEIGNAIGADRRTVRRWRGHETIPTTEHRRHLEKLNELKYLLDTSFRSFAAAQRWLQTSVPGLKGRTPLYAITEGDLDDVLKVLGTLKAGAFR